MTIDMSKIYAIYHRLESSILKMCVLGGVPGNLEELVNTISLCEVGFEVVQEVYAFGW